MFGLVCWTEEGKSGEAILGERELLRLRFCEAVVRKGERTPAFLLRRRCRRAAKQMRKLGITRAVFPADFPFGAEFAAQGILPADLLPLYRGLAADLVQAALEGRGREVRERPVAVCADRLTAEVRQAVTALCIRNRYVLLSAPDREGAFCRQLRREYGVPIQQAEDLSQLERAGVVVLFSARAGLFPGQTVLELYDGGKLPPVRLLPEGEVQLPPDWDRDQLLGALWAAGALRPGQVRAVWTERDEKAEKEPENLKKSHKPNP